MSESTPEAAPDRSLVPDPRRTLLLGTACGLLLAGLLARLYFALSRPVWADEVFTLWAARLSFQGLFQALKVDSGPPLHYVLSKFLLAAFPEPGPGDVVVRLLSVLASIAHVPLLLRTASRMGSVSAGWKASILFSAFPLAVFYATEGRAYVVASLLILAAFERALSIRSEPSVSKAAVLGLLVGGAVLTHYLSVFPSLGFLAFWPGLDSSRRRSFLLAAGLALLVFVPWFPVVLGQPRAAMAWVMAEPYHEAAGGVLANLFFGTEAAGVVRQVLAAAACGLIAWIFSRRKLVPPLLPAFLGIGFGSLLIAGAFLPQILLPERSALLFLPYAVLLLAFSGALAFFGPLVIALGFLLAQARTWTRPTVIQDLAIRLSPVLTGPKKLGVAGAWGPEIRYHFERAKASGSVLLFPSAVEQHPGWYSEEGVSDEELGVEARDYLAAWRPLLLVLPVGYRCSAALRSEAARAGARRVAGTPLFEIIEVTGVPSPGP